MGLKRKVFLHLNLLTISEWDQITAACSLLFFLLFFFSIADQFSMAHNIAVNINRVIFWHINVYIQSAGCGSGLINSISWRNAPANESPTKGLHTIDHFNRLSTQLFLDSTSEHLNYWGCIWWLKKHFFPSSFPSQNHVWKRYCQHHNLSL